METSFFTGFGHLCRFILMCIIAVFFINATLAEKPITISSTTSPGSKMVDFRGESTKTKKVVLKWKMNNKGGYKYNVEKSRDGENFTEVDARDIKAESNGSFSWIDSYPKQVNCYRLKMTDETGAKFYSKVLVMQIFKTGQVSLVAATPDLSLNDINIDMDLKEHVMVTMNILNKKGEIVMQQKESADVGQNQFRLKGSNALAAGDYYLNVIVNGEDKLMVHLIKS